MKNALIRAALWLALFLAAAPAMADQGSLCLPTTGTVSGLTFVQGTNTAIQALVTSNSGASAPANPCGAAPLTGQVWLDGSASPAHLRIYDGTNWLDEGAVDASGHVWTPPVGGGAASIASATTTNLGSIPQSYLTITGTTAITSFGSGATLGTAKIVRFAGALTLTYNATSLITPTAANITTAAGDTAWVVSLGGGNNLVASYERASGKPLANAIMVGDSGSGGTAGLVPAPSAGDAAADKVLGAGGSFKVAVPTGTLVDFAGSSAPTGWLLCYGQAVNRTTYAALFAVISTTYGVGDGSTTFNLPDVRGRFTAGLDNMGGSAASRLTGSTTQGVNANALGATGGEQAHTQTLAELVPHHHGLAGNVATTPTGAFSIHTNDGATGSSPATADTGGGAAFNVVPPAIAFNKIIKF